MTNHLLQKAQLFRRKTIKTPVFPGRIRLFSAVLRAETAKIAPFLPAENPY